MELKIMNYNILHRFYTSEKPFKLEKGRLKKFKDNLRSKSKTA